MIKAAPDDPLVFGVPRSWRRRHSGLPEPLADAGFVMMVAGTNPLCYRLVQGGAWMYGRPGILATAPGTLERCIADAYRLLQAEQELVQTSFLLEAA